MASPPKIFKLDRIMNLFNEGCVLYQRALKAYENKSYSEAEIALVSAAKAISDSLESALKIYLQYIPKLSGQDRHNLNEKPNFHNLITLMEKYADPPLAEEMKIPMYGFRDMRNEAAHNIGVPTVEEIKQAIEGVGQFLITYFAVERSQLKDCSETKRIHIHLQGNYAGLSDDSRAEAIEAIATVLGIAPQNIDVVKVYDAGGIAFELGVSLEVVERLRSLLQANNIKLHHLKVEQAILPRESDETEVWVFEGGRFLPKEIEQASPQPVSKNREARNIQKQVISGSGNTPIQIVGSNVGDIVLSSPAPPLSSPQTEPELNSSALRRQLNRRFDDAELNAFCLDYFPEVYDKFGGGMQKNAKITLLLDFCRRMPAQGQKLLLALKEYE
jgi:hypothetical protein